MKKKFSKPQHLFKEYFNDFTYRATFKNKDRNECNDKTIKKNLYGC